MRIPTRRKYPVACKERAVTLAGESDQPLAQPARDLGVNANTCHTWSGQDHRAERREPQGQAAHLDEAVKRLRQDNTRGKAARDIRNKAAASWAPPLP
ncbi:MAG TPA: transposase [Candidatus Saccharimonadia bacterium]|jgi:transposase|nr:transposase [Candidatus Saccharimonadia bacterium]